MIYAPSTISGLRGLFLLPLWTVGTGLVAGGKVQGLGGQAASYWLPYLRVLVSGVWAVGELRLWLCFGQTPMDDLPFQYLLSGFAVWRVGELLTALVEGLKQLLVGRELSVSVVLFAHHRYLYSCLHWLGMIKNGLIRVAVKVKPCAPGERVMFVEEGGVVVTLPSEQIQRVEVDHVHDANQTDLSIYQTGPLGDLISKFIQGFNVTIISYGQTGSGKTFAFEGNKQHQGIIFHAIRDIYLNKSPQATAKCSFIQLYNQKVTDMLGTDPQRSLRVRWQAERQFIVEDLTQKHCAQVEDMLGQWTFANRNRVVAANKINEYSSRSHSLFCLRLEDQDQDGNHRSREALFVDLAGSQRMFSPVGRLTKQAIEINKSLFFLRKVILSLEDINGSHKEQYVPYRDSKLTSLLKRALGGNCLTYLIACINPNKDFIQETLSTLQYAVSARKIQNRPVVNVDQKAREIRELKDERQKMKRELEVATMQIQMFRSLERQEELKRASNSQYANRIIECLGTVRELLKSNKTLRQELQQQKTEKKNLARELQQSEQNLSQAKKSIPLFQGKESSRCKNVAKKLQTSNSEHMTPTNGRLQSKSLQIFGRRGRGAKIVHRSKFTIHEGCKR